MFAIDNTLLVLMDIQGKLETLMHEEANIYKNLEIIIKAMNVFKVPILWMEQVPDKLGPSIEQVSDNLYDLMPIPKYTFSACGNNQFMDKLGLLKRKQILLTGIETHICVFQTAHDLLSKGYDVQAIADCVSSRTETNKILGLKRMNEAGATITSCEMILFELMKSTKAEGFKEITRLIK